MEILNYYGRSNNKDSILKIYLIDLSKRNSITIQNEKLTLHLDLISFSCLLLFNTIVKEQKCSQIH